jgi:hypothetical protein
LLTPTVHSRIIARMMRAMMRLSFASNESE